MKGGLLNRAQDAGEVVQLPQNSDQSDQQSASSGLRNPVLPVDWQMEGPDSHRSAADQSCGTADGNQALRLFLQAESGLAAADGLHKRRPARAALTSCERREAWAKQWSMPCNA